MNKPAGLELLEHRIRPADSATPHGALVLFHGRGADHNDLFPLLDVFDPGHRLVGVTPRAPLQLPPGGFHWYLGAGIPTPDHDTFHQTYQLVGKWLEAFERESGIPPSRTIVGGFSQGTVMTYAISLGKGRPRPAGLLALSGFMPRVEGFELDIAGARDLPVSIGHGTMDSVIPVEWGRKAKELLETAGARVSYAEAPMSHMVDPALARVIPEWIEDVMASIPDPM